MKHKDNAANYALNTAVKVDQNRLMAERQPEALERVLARISSLVESKREHPLILEGTAAALTEEASQLTESP